jgi:hypothetical protein
MMADPSAHARERVILLEKLQGFFVFSVVDERNISLNAHMRGTGDATGRTSCFADGISAGNCLRVLFVRGFPVAESLVVLVGNFDGADFGAFAAACAFGKINKPGLLTDMSRKPSRFPFKTDKFCIGK